jgi:CRISPR system Cascade subunit CasB
MSHYETPDFMRMFELYQQFKPGSKAELKRVVEPDDLIEVPSFYHLLNGHAGNNRIKRVIYCLPVVKAHDPAVSIGQALAKAGVSEKRLFMVVRSESPNDLIQLRRLLKMLEPSVNWPEFANLVYWWGKRNKQTRIQLASATGGVIPKNT